MTAELDEAKFVEFRPSARPDVPRRHAQIVVPEPDDGSVLVAIANEQDAPARRQHLGAECALQSHDGSLKGHPRRLATQAHLVKGWHWFTPSVEKSALQRGSKQIDKPLPEGRKSKVMLCLPQGSQCLTFVFKAGNHCPMSWQ